jgi:hypothetical protein
MERPENKTTLIAFFYHGAKAPECLTKWRQSTWGERLYLVTEKGVIVGAESIHTEPMKGWNEDSWTFTGVTRLLMDGSGRSDERPL